MNGNASKKLLEKMRSSPCGWGQKDFEHLFNGFEFQWREGKKHRIYIHSKFKDLSISVPRHDSLKEWVARESVKLIDDLISRSERNVKSDGKDK